MTNIKGNRGNNGVRCAVCGKKLRGYLQWLCKEHRTKEWAAYANGKKPAVETGTPTANT